tara:strand:+ start:318 stop:512 length:195 start_codon:yes stop_codon:yes gene_type:complete
MEINHSEQDILTKIADLLDCKSNEIEINAILDKQEITERFNPKENVVKEYHTTYFHLSTLLFKF